MISVGRYPNILFVCIIFLAITNTKTVLELEDRMLEIV